MASLIESTVSEASTPKTTFSISSQIRKKLRALTKLQNETAALDAEFHEAVFELDQTFQPKYDRLFERRKMIVNGEYEPTPEDCQLEFNDLDDKGDYAEEGKEGAVGITGVPHFWLNALRVGCMPFDMFQESDCRILKHLIDVTSESMRSAEMSFELKFHFRPNELFENSFLTEEHFVKCEPEADRPFYFAGPEIHKCIGCQVQWKDEHESLLERK